MGFLNLELARGARERITKFGFRYATMRDTYIRSGEGFLLAYAITSEDSFEEVKTHYNQILRVKDVDAFPMVLVANKADLVDQSK